MYKVAGDPNWFGGFIIEHNGEEKLFDERFERVYNHYATLKLPDHMALNLQSIIEEPTPEQWTALREFNNKYGSED